MRRTLLAATLCLPLTALAQAPAAEPAPKLRYSEGQILVLVAPSYPKDALAKGLTGRVEIVGTVQGDGRIKNPRITSIPPSTEFEMAVMDVLTHWRFQPRVETPACGFVPSDARLTLWFDIENGKPKVSHSKGGPAAPASVALAAPEIVTTRAPVKAMAPSYPAALAGKGNAPATVTQIAYVGVKADGSVATVTLAPALYYQEFQTTVFPALGSWRFAPTGSPWCGEFELQFNRP